MEVARSILKLSAIYCLSTQPLQDTIIVSHKLTHTQKGEQLLGSEFKLTKHGKISHTLLELSEIISTHLKFLRLLKSNIIIIRTHMSAQHLEIVQRSNVISPVHLNPLTMPTVSEEAPRVPGRRRHTEPSPTWSLPRRVALNDIKEQNIC